VSEADANIIRTRLGRSDVDVVENGVDTGYFRESDSQREPGNILFLGSLDWRPNVDAVRLLVNDVLPRVLARIPSAKATIVGRSPPEWLEKLVDRTPNSKLYADVPDVRPFLAKASAMVVPLRIGGGTRLKILEAAAAGLPVVSTAIGAEGLSLRPGDDYLVADSAEELAASLCEVLTNPGLARRLADCAHSVVQRQYDWDGLSSKLEDSWLRAVEIAHAAKGRCVGAT
jgi:glycosyltransferase involved in cell wall biosynthesis